MKFLPFCSDGHLVVNCGAYNCDLTFFLTCVCFNIRESANTDLQVPANVEI